MTEGDSGNVVYLMRWSAEALQQFVDLFNANDVRNPGGQRVRLIVQKRGLDATFLLTPEDSNGR